LKSQAREQLLGLLPELQRRAGERIATDLDIGVLLQKQLEDIEQIEGVLEAAVQPKLNKLRLLGAGIGGLVGILHAIVS
jgi:hypothetical protein